MRRLLPLLLLLITACVPVTPLTTPTPAPTATPTLTPSPTPDNGFIVTFHPEGPLYVGDQVSAAISAPEGSNITDQQVAISFNGNELGASGFGAFILGGRPQARLWWIWDTHTLEAGAHILTFSLLPSGPVWQETVTLLPATDLPLPERNARWETVITDCCNIYYISDTDAARDIAALTDMSNRNATDVETRMQATFTDKIPVVFFPRVLGHSGFAGDAIYVTYLDRNYTGNDTEQVLHHEMVHWLDAQLGGSFRPTILVEGLAVYLSGGHFKPEPVAPRAAALLDMGMYIPLKQLTDNFYPEQHEVGYLEGAALVQYLIEAYGWDAFNAFYRDMQSPESGSQSSAMDDALRRHFNIGFDQLEEQFKDDLRQKIVTDADEQDVQLTIAFYDTVRRYQQMLDPSAYYLSAWLPDGKVMRERGIVADFTRHPDSPINVGLETLLVQADQALRSSNYTSTEQIIDSVNVMLDILAKPGDTGIPLISPPSPAMNFFNKR